MASALRWGPCGGYRRKCQTTSLSHWYLVRHETKMMIENVDFNLIVGVWGSLAATAAAYIAWRVYVWQRAGDVPVVLCQKEQPLDLPEWVVFRIIVRNTTNSRWRATNLTVQSPRTARGFSRWHGPQIDDPLGGSSPNFDLASREAKNPFQLTLTVDPVGTPRSQYHGGGDVGNDTIYILKSSLNSSRIKMTLKLVSDDARPKIVEVPILRSLED